MNKRIRQLVKQAGGHFSTHNLASNPVQHRESIELWDKNIEKFAELIVVECAMFVVTELEGKVGSAIADATANRLEEHFYGVEE